MYYLVKITVLILLIRLSFIDPTCSSSICILFLQNARTPKNVFFTYFSILVRARFCHWPEWQWSQVGLIRVLGCADYLDVGYC